MKLNDFFDSGADVSSEEVKRFTIDHKPDEYQLLDVRQPGGYKKQHLPGAILIPVKELPDRFDELDPSKPTFVY